MRNRPSAIDSNGSGHGAAHFSAHLPTSNGDGRSGSYKGRDTWVRRHCRYNLVLWILLFATVAMFAAAWFRANRHPPKMIIISVSGMRWDYLSRVPARDTPFFTGFLQNGSRAEWLEAGFLGGGVSMLTSVFTGLYPDQHGVIGEHFMDAEHGEMQTDGADGQSADDPAWWGSARPIWHLSGEQWRDAALYNIHGACMRFDGYEPRLCHAPSGGRPDDLAVNIADALEHLKVWQYHLAVIHTDVLRQMAEQHGAESQQLLDALRTLDSQLRQLDAAEERGINVLIVSDGGLTDAEHLKEIIVDEHIPEQVLHTVTGYGPTCFVYSAEQDIERIQQALAGVAGLRVYRHGQFPTRFRLAHAQRSPQLLVVADSGYFLESTRPLGVAAVGGYDDTKGQLSDMRGVVMGRGPNFKAGVVVPALHSVDVHALLSHLLWVRNTGSGQMTHAIRMLV